MNPSDSPSAASPSRPPPHPAQPPRFLGQYSPRPSLESSHPHCLPSPSSPSGGPSSPSSPFLHNLTQRLRKGSSASSHGVDPVAAALPLPTPPVVVDPVKKTEGSRAAKRKLLALVRDDWEYPETSKSAQASSSPPAAEPLTYRLREESLSDLEAEEIFARRRAGAAAAAADPYKFESPDAVGDAVAERRRRRRRLAEEETGWNPGLRTWSRRRDAWTGAVQQRPVVPPAAVRPGLPGKRSTHHHIFRRSQQSHNVLHHHERDASRSTDGSAGGGGGLESTPEVSSIDSVESDPGPEEVGGPWLPVYPPVVAPDDARIRPAMYPTIYAKVVVQGLAPNVPIPLRHMIPALVEGWKAEGNWPPQPAAAAAVQETKKKGSSRPSSSTFARWRREHHPHETRAAEAEDGRSRVKRSIGMMKKVLGGDGHGGPHHLGIEFREPDAADLDGNVALNRDLVEDGGR